MATITPNWLDRAIGFLAPRAALRRVRARAAADVFLRHYEGAGSGRRTSGWHRPRTDANAAIVPAIANLRAAARDLVRNNGFAESALTTIVDHVVGWGIVAKPNPANAQAAELWKAWAETTACDADGRHDFYGLQKLVQRTVSESGEVLIRLRRRLPDDGFPLPIQLQVLDPDYLDTARTNLLGTTGRIVYGIEFDPIGRRRAYWLFTEHPGSEFAAGNASSAVPADSVLHVFRLDRPGQVRGVSWFAPVLLAFKDFDDFDDATLMTQKVAACLSVVVTDSDGSSVPLGTLNTETTPYTDTLSPGAIINAAPGRDVKVVTPPTTRDFPAYAEAKLRGIATGIGVAYEDLTGSYTGMPYSAARMSRIRHWARVEDWRWRIMIPQFCDPVWRWFVQAAAITDRGIPVDLAASWTPQPPPMIDPQNEALAYQRAIRAGLKSQSEALRELGYDPEEVLTEIGQDNATLDRLKLVLDSDARNTTQAGQLQGEALAGTQPESPAPAPPAAPPGEGGDGNGEGSASASPSPSEGE